MNVVVLFESAGGNTRRAAEYIGGAMLKAGADDVSVRNIAEPDLGELAAADFIIIGTWTHGAFFWGQAPAKTEKVGAMPVIDRKKAAVFLTYALNPGKALDKFETIVESRAGAEVVASAAIHRKRIPEEAAAFAKDAMASYQKATTKA